jgi:hypothetical protein
MKCWPFTEGITQNFGRDDQLREECIFLSKYLIDLQPSKYIIEKYSDACRSASLHMNDIHNKFDAFTLTLARTHAILLKLTDVYTAVFARTSLLRKKLVLLLAIFESCGETYPLIDHVEEYSKLGFYTRCFLRSLAFAFLLLLSSCIFALPHFLSSHTVKIRFFLKRWPG